MTSPAVSGFLQGPRLVLRAVRTHPDSVKVLEEEIAGLDSRIDAAVRLTFPLLSGLDDPEARARLVTEKLGTILQAALLLRGASPEVTDGFIATRLEGGGGRFYGTLPHTARLSSIVEHAIPA